MNVKKYIEEIKEKVKVEENNPSILLELDDICIEIIDRTKDLGDELIKNEDSLIDLRKKQLDYYRFDASEDIFKELKTKEDRELVMYHTKEIRDIELKISEIKNDLKLLENLRKQVSEIKSSVKVYLEWQNYLGGK